MNRHVFIFSNLLNVINVKNIILKSILEHYRPDSGANYFLFLEYIFWQGCRTFLTEMSPLKLYLFPFIFLDSHRFIFIFMHIACYMKRNTSES